MEDPDVSRRRVIDSVIASICLNHGFSTTEQAALETLSEMFVTYICQLLVQAKLFAELQGRTEPTCHDVASALIELGVDLRLLHKYMRSISYQTGAKVATPAIASIPKPPQVLHAVKPQRHFNYIDDHFPVFPDPHTYITTECKIKNEREYTKYREMLAEHKNTIEKNLVKYRLRNELLQHERKELSLFHDDTDDPTFMLISNEIKDNATIPPYVKGLLGS